MIGLPPSTGQDTLEQTVLRLNGDKSVHGILLFRPLPKGLSEDGIKDLISPEKDVDCMSPENTARVFAADASAYPPCTSQAVMELLKFYNIDLTGKKAVVVGRSWWSAGPLRCCCSQKNATVTICHTKTVHLAEECRARGHP